MFHILVVDDDKNIRYIMKEVLESNSYTVFTAENGKKAFDLMENEHIDLAIVDIMMPEIDGYEFTKALRQFNQEMPVLMISAKQLAEDRKKGFAVGIDDYMSKPIDTDELLLHVKALLRRYKIINERKILIRLRGTGKCKNCPRKSFYCFINFYLTRTKSSPVFNLWMKFGVWIAKRMLKRLPYISAGLENALASGKSLK